MERPPNYSRPYETAVDPLATSYERPEPVISDTGVAAHSQKRIETHRFSLGATFLGWAVAAFFTLVFVAAISALLGRALLADLELNEVAIGGLIGYFVATFAAYLIGGYAAGRIALWDGVKHGTLTVAWAVLFAIAFVALAGTAFAIDPGFDVNIPIPLDAADITTGGVIAVVITLVAMLAGSALGGSIGERYHARVHGLAPRRRRAMRTRGRPL